jgi:hypothetical protein
MNQYVHPVNGILFFAQPLDKENKDLIFEIDRSNFNRRGSIPETINIQRIFPG